MQTSLTLDEGKLTTVGVRRAPGRRGARDRPADQTGYAYADGFDPTNLREAARVAARIARDGAAGRAAAPSRVGAARAPFTLAAPAPLALDEARKIALLQRADDAARAHDPRITRSPPAAPTARSASWSRTATGVCETDDQFLSRLTRAGARDRGRQAPAAASPRGGCVDAATTSTARAPEAIAREAAATAVTLLAAREPEAGTYPVVVAPGWGGVLVHECFGHSMEGDGIRKQTSIRAVADGPAGRGEGRDHRRRGMVPYSRGSFRVDDEGTPRAAHRAGRGRRAGRLPVGPAELKRAPR